MGLQFLKPSFLFEMKLDKRIKKDIPELNEIEVVNVVKLQTDMN